MEAQAITKVFEFPKPTSMTFVAGCATLDSVALQCAEQKSRLVIKQASVLDNHGTVVSCINIILRIT